MSSSLLNFSSLTFLVTTLNWSAAELRPRRASDRTICEVWLDLGVRSGLASVMWRCPPLCGHPAPCFVLFNTLLTPSPSQSWVIVSADFLPCHLFITVGWWVWFNWFKRHAVCLRESFKENEVILLVRFRFRFRLDPTKSREKVRIFSGADGRILFFFSS